MHLFLGMKFCIPALTAPYVHLFDQHFLSVKIRMCLKNGEKLPNLPSGDPPLIAPVRSIITLLILAVLTGLF